MICANLLLLDLLATGEGTPKDNELAMNVKGENV
mgnify:FL=1